MEVTSIIHAFLKKNINQQRIVGIPLWSHKFELKKTSLGFEDT